MNPEFGADTVLAKQMSFYAETAQSYEAWHIDGHDEHFVALRYAMAFMHLLGVDSVLDVGCGTGRALSYLRRELPQARLRGLDPSPELLELATTQNGIPADWLCKGSGYELPYPPESFDVVIATAVLHHVEYPHKVLCEMARVARKAIFVSDMNTYGMGRLAYRFVKLLARAAGLNGLLNRLRYGGHAWFYSQDDGIAFPYSVFDATKPINGSFDDVLVVPTAGTARRLTLPIAFATHALLVGIKDSSARAKALSS